MNQITKKTPKQNKTPRSDNPKWALDAEDEEYSHIHIKKETE